MNEWMNVGRKERRNERTYFERTDEWTNERMNDLSTKRVSERRREERNLTIIDQATDKDMEYIYCYL